MLKNRSKAKESILKLREITKNIPFAMLTTLESNGQMHSRPMTPQELDEDGCIWFFAYKNSGLTFSVENEQSVNISYSSSDKNLYISISGAATVVDDTQKAKELWKPNLKTWFPEGLEDPNLVLLKVQAQCAEYWDEPTSKVVQLVDFKESHTSDKHFPEASSSRKKLDLNYSCHFYSGSF